jgi:mercuric ion transport protein
MSKSPKGSLITAIIGTLLASLCCVAPLLLLMLGIGGAWVSTLTHLEFLRPIGIIITIVFLGLAYYKLYITPKKCSLDKPCSKPKNLRRYRMLFWVITFILMILMAFPWYAFLFY